MEKLNLPRDELWPGGPRLVHAEQVFPLGTDAVLLAAFASKAGGRMICDLGCGSGVVALLTLWELPTARAVCADIQPAAVAAALENARENGLSDRMRVVQADLRTPSSVGAAGSFDLVVANPPYFPVGSGKSSEPEALSLAREERACTLADVCAAAAYLVRWGGKFALVHRPERLTDVLCTLRAHGLEPKRLRFVQNTAAAAPSLILVESRRGGSPGLSAEPPLLLTDPNGGPSKELLQIYHRKD